VSKSHHSHLLLHLFLVASFLWLLLGLHYILHLCDYICWHVDVAPEGFKGFFESFRRFFVCLYNFFVFSGVVSFWFCYSFVVCQLPLSTKHFYLSYLLICVFVMGTTSMPHPSIRRPQVTLVSIFYRSWNIQCRIMALKSRLWVTQGHRKWYNSKAPGYGFILAFHSNYGRNFGCFDTLHECVSQRDRQTPYDGIGRAYA